MHFNVRKIIGLLVVAFGWGCLYSQNSFTTIFSLPNNEGVDPFIENSKGEYIGYIFIEDSDLVDYSYLYKLASDGDTLFSRRFEKIDTLLFMENVIQTSTNPIEYLLEGKGYNTVEPLTHVFTFFTKIDSSFNTIWEKTYQLRPINNLYYEIYAHLMQKKDSGYFYATSFKSIISDMNTMILFDLGENGDSLTYRAYEGDSAGVQLMDVLYNHDTSAYLLLTDYAHHLPSMGATCITVDFDFNQTSVFHYPRYFDDGLTGKLLPNGELLTGALYENKYDFHAMYSNMAVYKYDTSFNLLAECYVADPDFEIRKDNGFRTIDYYYPNSIFVAGTFDYDYGIWVQHPSWIVIGKMDSDLNLISEKYIGGDAYYRFCNLAATSDGGLLITATRYDYLTQEQEHDVYIFKLDSLDLTVGLAEYDNTRLADAIVYPNPASEYVFVRTAIKNADFVLFDMAGSQLKHIPLSNLITKMNLDGVPSGTYVWGIYQNSTLIETGKLILTK